MNILPILSTVITYLFAVAVLHRYAKKGGTHLLLWGVGLILYGLGTLSEVILSLFFSGLVLKLWYLSGAMLTAAWLGQGTLYLLVRKHRIVNITAICLGVISVLAALLLLISPLTAAASTYQIALPISAQYKDILVRNGFVIGLTIFLNLYGTLLLVGGALYSAYLFWRKRVILNRVIGNILIAAGAMAPAMAGSFVKAGLVDLLYLSEAIGVVLMYAGFSLATAHRPAKEALVESMTVK